MIQQQRFIMPLDNVFAHPAKIPKAGTPQQSCEEFY